MAFDVEFAERFAERFKRENPDERYKRKRTVTRRDLVAASYEDIIAKRKAGYSFEGIAAHFEQLGAPIRLSTLKSYVLRLARGLRPRRSAGAARARGATSRSRPPKQEPGLQQPPPASAMATPQQSPKPDAGSRERIRYESPPARRADVEAIDAAERPAKARSDVIARADESVVVDDGGHEAAVVLAPSSDGGPPPITAPEATTPHEALPPKHDPPPAARPADIPPLGTEPTEKALTLAEIRAVAPSSSFAVPRRKPLHEL